MTDCVAELAPGTMQPQSSQCTLDSMSIPIGPITNVFLVSVTSSIERSAQHEAKRTEQKAKGELERQKLQNEKEAEEARHLLLELQAVASAVESSGQAKAEAQAQAERLLIEGQSAIEREYSVTCVCHMLCVCYICIDCIVWVVWVC